MDIRKLAPWNWFKNEEEEQGKSLPVEYSDKRARGQESSFYSPLAQLHREVDRLFNNTFHGFGGWPSFDIDRPFTPLTTPGLLKPQVDIGADKKEYTITVEIPGVDEKEVTLEIDNNTLIVKGEKTHEKEKKDKNYYRVERSYGSFQRILSLPEDADQENVKATFKNGVLTIVMPRKAIATSEVKQINIKSNE